MVDIQSEKTPLARLMLFLICVSVAGSIVAGVHYYTVDLPKQEAQALLTPKNGQELKAACNICVSGCLGKPDEYGCLQTCQLAC